MSKQEYNNAALAASLSPSCHPACALASPAGDQGSVGRDPGDNRALSIAPGAGAPLLPVDLPLTNILSAGMVQAMVQAKCVTWTVFPQSFRGLVQVVQVVQAILTYRTCARARVCFSFSLFNYYNYYKKCMDHVDQANVDAGFAWTIRMDHVGPPGPTGVCVC